MKLTDMEMEIMNVLWQNEDPVTASDIVSCSNQRTWKERSIYIMLNSLQAKEMVVAENYRPATSKSTKAYRAIVTKEEYAVAQVVAMDVDFVAFFQAMLANEKYENAFGQTHPLKNIVEKD